MLFPRTLCAKTGAPRPRAARSTAESFDRHRANQPVRTWSRLVYTLTASTIRASIDSAAYSRAAACSFSLRNYRDMLALRVVPRSTHDLGVAFDWIVAHCRREGLARPAIFSISFGSTPAIGIATDPKRADQLGALLLFGGFCDFHATVRFAISGRAYHDGHPVLVPHDPPKRPRRTHQCCRALGRQLGQTSTSPSLARDGATDMGS